MVYDCFPFFNELDLLEIRCNVLKNIVDTFVIAELNSTHSGKPTDLVLDANFDRFEGYPIVYVVLEVPELVLRMGPPAIEHWQRRQLIIALQEELDLANDDTVIFSDIDELPNPNHLQRGLYGRYIQNMYYFHMNTRASYDWYAGTMVLPVDTLLKHDIQELRTAGHARACQLPQIPDGGWHWSSLGGQLAVSEKLSSFSHTEFDNQEAKLQVFNYMQTLKDIHGSPLSVVSTNELPQYVQDNLDKYASFLWQPLI